MLRFLIIVSCAINLAFSQRWIRFGDQEYYFARNNATFAIAYQACVNMSAHLVVIPNRTIETFLRSSIPSLSGGLLLVNFFNFLFASELRKEKCR